MRKKESIGKRDRKVTIRVKSTTKDAYGQEVITWSDGQQCWAAIDYNEAQSDLEANTDATVSTTLIFFSIPAQLPVDVGQRLAYDGKQFEILAVIEDGRNYRKTLKATHTLQ